MDSFPKLGGFNGSHFDYQRSLPSQWTVRTLVLAFVIGSFVNFAVKLYHNRKRIVELQKQGLPIAPEWNWLTGNLLLLAKLSAQLPQGLHKTLMFSDILRDHFKEDGCCYIDLWPVSYPFLLVMDPRIASQVAQTIPKMAIERPSVLPVFFKPVAGGLNLFDLSGEEWKRWRTIFNKGFSTDALSAMIPAMVEETEIYRSILHQKAQSEETFQLDSLTLRFTMSLIGRTILNTSLGAQTGYNDLADGMLTAIAWMMPNREINPLEQINFVRDLVHWWNGRKMNRFSGNILDDRYKDLQRSNSSSKAKSIMDLVLEAYIKEAKLEGRALNSTLDKDFRAFAITQIRLFLFVGHDSMSTTICYALYLLSKNPECLKKLRDEHNSVYPDVKSTGIKLTQEPNTLNNLPYTTAVLKETLRLFPPGSATRQGMDGIELVDDRGKRYPTSGCIIWILHVAMHSEENYWVDADKFIPERYLVEPGHRLYPLRDAWRAFEWGPRNCIGQALAMLELKLVLVMIARDFDFTSAYDELDKNRPFKERMSYRGERAWLMERGAAHPADMMPGRMRLSTYTS